MLARETSNFRSAQKNKVHFDPRTKNRSTPVFTLKPDHFLSPARNQVNFDPNTEVKSISISTLKTSQFCMPPDTNTKFTLSRLNQVNFTCPPTRKPSQFLLRHVYTRVRVILVAGLRYVPFLLYVVLVCVVYRSYAVTTVL